MRKEKEKKTKKSDYPIIFLKTSILMLIQANSISIRIPSLNFFYLNFLSLILNNYFSLILMLLIKISVFYLLWDRKIILLVDLEEKKKIG